MVCRPFSAKAFAAAQLKPRQLYERVEEWFREQKPNREQWAQVIYALARSGRSSSFAAVDFQKETALLLGVQTRKTT